MLDRRRFLGSGLRAVGAAVFAPMVNRGRFALGASRHEYSRRTVDLVQDSLVIDMLGLVTLDWDKWDRWRRTPSAFTSADASKLLESGINVFHPAVDLNAREPFRAAKNWLESWNGFLASHPESLVRVDCAPGLCSPKTGGRVGVIHGFQNSDHFRTVADVDLFYGLGQRVSQLTYNAANRLGCGCLERRDTGLTEFGAGVVRRMNQLGMAVDISHTGEITSREALEISSAPVLITHANCKALNPHWRCKSDATLKRMAATGGVIGITSIRRFVCDTEPTTIENCLDHFDYAARLIGVEHLGVGSDNDLDGRDQPGCTVRMDIEGLAHPLRIYDLTEGLVRRRYTDQSIRLILGGNFQRALDAIWRPPAKPEMELGPTRS